jgi:tRNA nucleotidyltransferase (CCA-adding enzyme)
MVVLIYQNFYVLPTAAMLDKKNRVSYGEHCDPDVVTIKRNFAMPGKKPLQENPLTVVTTHVNSDFDAIASVLAAQKLYPGSIVVLPGSNEKNLRDFFVSSMAYLFNMKNIQDIDLSKVKRLVIVDTKQKNRIGPLAGLLDDPSVEIHIFDHHPVSDNDISADRQVNELSGATVSILIEKIREHNIPISPDEATVMCLGIYEDTGSFTFTSTTPRDFESAAFLVSRGASLGTIANMISKEMTPEQVDILNSMIKNSQVHDINGTAVVITSICLEDYVPDFAFLVHKMQRMKSLNVVFALAQMGNRIYIVGRSGIPEVDTAGALFSFGGGGHAYAASASVKNMTLPQAEQQLLTILNRQIQSKICARDLMSSPAISTTPDITCRQAGELLTRYNINALLITEKENAGGALLGFITRQVIEKALYHNLGDTAVSEYMTTEVLRVDPDDDLYGVQERIIDGHQRILPVVSDGAILGVITRTDLLNLMVSRSKREKEQQPQLIDSPGNSKTKNIIRLMIERLPGHMMDLLRAAGETASAIGYSAYVVGGFVRDMFLFRPTEDVDLVIEGDGIDFARQFAGPMDARVHYHSKFGTAVITFADGFKIDVASSRLEYYQFPAALPTVEMSSIKLDLFRRDFTINTMAVCLNPEKFGTLIDFFSAQRDIKEKTIRVLHNLSFVEDPTRVFRAIRFEQRFGFTIGKMTSGLINNAVKMNFFKKLSGRRVFGEISLILEEDNPVPAIQRLAEYKLLAAVHPAIRISKSTLAALNSVREVLSWYDLLFLEKKYMKWAVYFLVLVNRCDQATTIEICGNFELNRKYQSLFTTERFEAIAALSRIRRDAPVKNSSLYEQLKPFRTELVLFIMALADRDEIKKQISHYILQLKTVRPLLKGNDLRQMGIPSGPVYSRIFREVLFARLDGLVTTKKDEMEFAAKYAARH